MKTLGNLINIYEIVAAHLYYFIGEMIRICENIIKQSNSPYTKHLHPCLYAEELSKDTDGGE